MRVERVPLPRVRAKLQEARRELVSLVDGDLAKVEASGGPKALATAATATSGAPGGPPDAEDEFDRVKRRIEELQKEQELKKQRRKERKKKAAAAAAGAAAGGSSNGGNNSNAKPLGDNPYAAALEAMGLPTSFTGC